MKALSLILVSISLVSSCTTIEYITAPLSLPAKFAEKDVLTQEELKCLTVEARDKVVLLDKRRKTLRNTIETTRGK